MDRNPPYWRRYYSDDDDRQDTDNSVRDMDSDLRRAVYPERNLQLEMANKMKQELKMIDLTNSEIADFLIESHKKHPEDWLFTKFDATHIKYGVIVWLSNGYSGVSIGFDINNPIIGKIDMWSVFFGRFIPWRRKLYQYFSKHRPAATNEDRQSLNKTIMDMRMEGFE